MRNLPLARVPLNDQILSLYITEPPEFAEERLEGHNTAGFVHHCEGTRRRNDRNPVDFRRLLRRRGERPRDRRSNQAADNKFATAHAIPRRSTNAPAGRDTVSLDHLIGADHDRRRDSDAKRLGSIEVDH